MTYKNSSCSCLTRNEFTGPIFGLRHKISFGAPAWPIWILTLEPEFFGLLLLSTKFSLKWIKNKFFYIIDDKVENILKGSLDSISSPSPLVKIQIMGGKVCLRCKGKTLLGIVNKLLKTKSLLTSSRNVLSYYFK